MNGHKAFITLREILAFLYDDEIDARRIAYDSGLDVQYISFSGKAINNWNAILLQAQKENKVAELMGISFKEFRENEKLTKAWHDYLVTEGRKRARLVPQIPSKNIRWRWGWIGISILVFVAVLAIFQFPALITQFHLPNTSHQELVVSRQGSDIPSRVSVLTTTIQPEAPTVVQDPSEISIVDEINTATKMSTPNPTLQMLAVHSIATPSYTIVASVPTVTPKPTNLPILPMPQMLGFVSSYTPSDQVVNGQMIIHLMNTDSHQVTNIEPGFDPSWSPDRQLIAYGSSLGTISIMNADGSNSRIVTNQEDWQPSWSPDGNQIVFASARAGTRQIYVMDKNGQNQVRLTNHPFQDRHPAWAPDGAAIAFISNRTGRWQIWSMASTGNNQIQLTDGEYNYYKPTWSPDGQKLIFGVWTGTRNEIWTMNKDGGGIQELITNSVYTLEGVGYGLSWSSNGWIAYVSDIDGRPQIYAKHITEQDAIRVTIGDTYDYFPVWIGE